MNSKSINRNVWALTLSLCLGVICFSTLSAQAADPPKGTERKGQAGVEMEMKQPVKDPKRNMIKDWSPSHRYYCWWGDGDGGWSPDWLPGPVFACSGIYNRQPPNHKPTVEDYKKVKDCNNTGGVWAGEDGKGGCTRPQTKAGKTAQAMCSQAKMEVLDRLRAVEACAKADKEGRVSEAKNCRGALKNVPAPFRWDKTLRPTPASACPAIGPGDGAAGQVTCWSGVADGCAWAICNSGSAWCWANCDGHGCVFE